MKVLLAALHMSAHGTGQQSFGLSSTAAIGGAADMRRHATPTKPHSTLCPQLAGADISRKKANSRFEPYRPIGGVTNCKSRRCNLLRRAGPPRGLVHPSR